MKKVCISFITLGLINVISAQAFVKPDLQIQPVMNAISENVVYRGDVVSHGDVISRSTFALVGHFEGRPYVPLSKCTAVLIDKDILLTAGHCMHEFLSYGVDYWEDKSQSFQRAKVINRARHENYRIVDGRIHDDIAILQIDRVIPGSMPAVIKENFKIEASAKLIPAGMGDNKSPDETPMIDINAQKELETISNTLRSAKKDLSAAALEELKFKYAYLLMKKPLLKTSAVMMANQPADAKFFGATTEKLMCGGDSGGPSFVQESDGRYLLIGVHSASSYDDCRVVPKGKTVGVVDTNVPEYLEWIKDRISEFKGN